jgi:hypothetical protein
MVLHLPHYFLLMLTYRLAASGWIVGQLERAGELNLIRGLESVWEDGGIVAVFGLLQTPSVTERWGHHRHIGW